MQKTLKLCHWISATKWGTGWVEYIIPINKNKVQSITLWNYSMKHALLWNALKTFNYIYMLSI